MCGILAVVNGESSIQGITNVCKYMEQGAIVGQLRGEDSTGMFQVQRSGVIQVHKAPIEGRIFATTRKFKTLANSTDSARVTVMHHRAATRGAVNYENCHPFEHSDKEKYLIGVHNGSLNGTPHRYEGIDFDVDSDYAMYRLFKDREAAFKDLNGAYAFVWYENDGKLRVACNGERAFSFAFVHKKNVILMASEAGMLWWLAHRNGIEIDDILSPEAHRLLTFDPSQDLRAFTDVKIDKPIKQEAVVWPSQRGVTQGNFPTVVGTPVAASVTTSPVAARTDARAIELDLYYKAGEDVEFYPDKERCTAHQLVGTVLLETAINEVEVVNAILSPGSVQLMNNVRSGQVDSIITTVRGIDRSTSTLLLNNIHITCCSSKSEDTTDLIDGPGLIGLTKAEFKEMVKNGCSCCKAPITVQDGIDRDVGWNTTTFEPLCITCTRELVTTYG